MLRLSALRLSAFDRPPETSRAPGHPIVATPPQPPPPPPNLSSFFIAGMEIVSLALRDVRLFFFCLSVNELGRCAQRSERN